MWIWISHLHSRRRTESIFIVTLVFDLLPRPVGRCLHYFSSFFLSFFLPPFLPSFLSFFLPFFLSFFLSISILLFSHCFISNLIWCHFSFIGPKDWISTELTSVSCDWEGFRRHRSLDGTTIAPAIAPAANWQQIAVCSKRMDSVDVWDCVMRWDVEACSDRNELVRSATAPRAALSR